MCRSGALQVLDPRTPGKEAIVTGQFFDREVSGCWKGWGSATVNVFFLFVRNKWLN